MTIRKLIERGANIDAPIEFHGIAKTNGGVILSDHEVYMCDIYVDFDNIPVITAYYTRRNADEQSDDSNK